jgi:hypothetical protein
MSPGPVTLVVSCHAERPCADDVWDAFTALRRRLPRGVRVATLMRPPAPDEDETTWLERARDAAAHGPFGLHTHFVSATHARPPGAAPEHGERVRAQIAWLRERGLEPRAFCGGGWFVDEGVARAVADAGIVDCTATAFRPAYLAPGAPRLQLDAPARLRLDDRTTLLEVPSTHSIGAAARASLRPLRLPVVHVYFHDTDAVDRARRLALLGALAVLARRTRPGDLDELAAGAPERPFAHASAST